MAEIQEMLEESQMTLNTMNAMRHVAPFKERVVNMLTTLSDVAGWSQEATISILVFLFRLHQKPTSHVFFTVE